MSSHTCPRCGAVTDPVLPGGLCVTCHGRQDDTRQSVSVAADAPTPSFDPDAAGTLTFAAPADTTLTRDGEASDPFGVLPPDGYQLGELLGEGGMGRVYRAVGRATGQVVAVKKLRPERYTPGLLQRFVREARILARVNHPNVVRLHHFVPAAGDPHLVMEFVDGAPLSRRLAGGKGIPPDEAARLIADAARGVQAAHDAGATHRDLKPGNLLVSGAGQVKVSDFGLGKLAEADDGLTVTDQPIGGTPGFAAPEQVAEGGGCDERTDVWGLGACLHACLVGQPPYPTGRANLTRVLADPLVPPRAVSREVPAVLDAIACKCLEKDPTRRYQSAAEVADDLDRYLRGESTVAKPLPWAARAWRRMRTVHRGLVAAWAVAAVTGVIALLATPRPPRDQVPPRPDDPLAAQQTALRAGREVVLIDDGKPVLEPKWLVGDAVLTPPTEAEPFATFASAETAVVALMTDPGVDRYRITARVRQRPMPPQVVAAAPSVKGLVGVVFGYRQADFPDGLKARAYMALAYTDRQPDPAPATPRKTYLAFYDRRMVQWPLAPPQVVDGAPRPAAITGPVTDEWMGPNARLNFVPALPGPWRTLTVDVTPDAITLDLLGAPCPLPLAELEQKGDRLVQNQNLSAGRDLGLHLWSPRSPVGLFVDGACVAVERFSLAPLTPPK